MASFFADLLGNAAIAGGKYFEGEIEQRRALDRQSHAEKLALERQEATDKLRADRAEKDRVAKQARTAEQILQAEKAGDEAIRNSPERAQQLLGAGVGDLSTLTPEQERMISQGQGLEYNNVVSRLGSQVKAANAAGLYDAADVLKEDYNRTVSALQAEHRRRYDERKADQKDVQQAETERHNRAAEERMVKALANKGSSGASVNEKLTTEKSIALRELKLLQDSVPKRQWETHPEMVATRKNISRLNKLLEARNPDDETPAPAAPKPQSTKDLAAKPGQRPDINSFFKK